MRRWAGRRAGVAIAFVAALPVAWAFAQVEPVTRSERPGVSEAQVNLVAPGVSEVRKSGPAETVVDGGPASPRLIGLTFERRGITGLRVRFEMTEPTRAEGFALDAPNRIVVDIHRATADVAVLPQPPATSLLTDFRLGRMDGDRLRVILDLAAPGRVMMLTADPTNRILTLDIEARTDALDPRPLVIDPAGITTAAISEARPAAAPAKRLNERFVVVIDPGHGGIDPGAVAPGGLVEKDVVFAVARALQRELASRTDLQVHMTRDGDVFVRLADRVRRATEANADLFVSIHADQFAGPAGGATVRGGSVYVLGDGPAARATAALVARENAVDALMGLPVDEASTARDVSTILADLTARETQDLSLRAQSLFVRDLRGAMTLAREPARAAAFRVLRQADIPAVLIELGYMSHVADMAELVSPPWQRRVASAMARAIDGYRDKLRQDRDLGRSPVP